MIKFVLGFKLKDFLPEIPAITEFTTKKTMGQDCDIMVAKHNVSREDQDIFAKRSHDNAEKAWEDGHHQKEVVPVEIEPDFKMIKKDNGIRSGLLRKISQVKTCF